MISANQQRASRSELSNLFINKLFCLNLLIELNNYGGRLDVIVWFTNDDN